MTWGIIADIDIESEKFRSIGSLRYTIAAILFLLKRRTYSGRLFLLKADSVHESHLPRTSSKSGPQLRFISNEKGDESYLSWEMKAGNYQMFVACNLPWISLENFWSPNSVLDNGSLTVSYTPHLDTNAIIAGMINGESGEISVCKSVSSHNVVAFVLEPQGYTYKKSKLFKSCATSLPRVMKGILNISGEPYSDDPIKVEVLPRILNVITPGWFDAHRWKRAFEAKHQDLGLGL